MIVAFEGIDGVGKSTQVKLVADRLTLCGYKVAVFKFPVIDSSIVEAVNKSKDEDAQWAIQKFLAKERVEAQKVMLDRKWDVVLLDRYVLSGWAYGMANGFDRDKLQYLDQDVAMPNLTFYLTDVEKPTDPYLIDVEANYGILASDYRAWFVSRQDVSRTTRAILHRLEVFGFEVNEP